MTIGIIFNGPMFGNSLKYCLWIQYLALIGETTIHPQKSFVKIGVTFTKMLIFLKLFFSQIQCSM